MKKIINYIRNKHNAIYRGMAFCLAVVVIVSFFPKQGKFKYEIQLGKQWMHEDLVAPFDFGILKSKEEIEKEKSELISKTKPYLRKDSAIYYQQLKSLKESFYKKWPINKGSSFDRNASLITAQNILTRLYDTGIVEIDEELESKPEDFDVNILTGNQAREAELQQLLTLQKAYNFVVDTLQRCSDKIDKELLSQLLEDNITHNIFYDRATTQKIINEQVSNISLTRDFMKQGMHIISKGEVIDQLRYQVLESLKSEYTLQYASKNNFRWITIGQVILVSICISLLFLFLMLFRKDTLEDNVKITFMLFIIAANIIMVSLAIRFEVSNIYILPFCIFPVIMRVFFDTRTALFTHIISCLIIGLIISNPYEFVMLEFMGGIVSIFSIINMRNRSQLFITVGLLFLTFCLTYVGITIIQEGKPESIDYIYFGYFGISAMITLFSYPLIFIFEKTFGFISDVTLLELADTNSPLLRELSIKAPGTFQHSLQVANIAEEAVRKIGGNTLLVRAGALYHDIGKMDAPIYFIENQAGGINPHNDLSSEESAHVIIDHVIKGIEKAKKNNIPDQIIDFIRTHHGNLKVEYFYRTYMMNNPDEEIDIAMFQYPGPVPYSKETAVLMMADGVEASSRSLKKYDAETIDNLVEKIINHQIDEKQFEFADISFKDITQIKKIFKKKLMNIYHLRIEYPSGVVKKPVSSL